MKACVTGFPATPRTATPRGPRARERGENADEGLRYRLAAMPVHGIADETLNRGLADCGEEVPEHRHRIALRAGRCDGVARVEERVDHLPPGKLRRSQVRTLQSLVHFPVAAGRVDVGLGAGDPVRAQRIGAGDGGADQLAHAVRDPCRTRRGQDQAQQVLQEGAFGREGRAAAELGVAGVDGMGRAHPEREPSGLGPALRRQRLPDQRDQAGGRGADIDGGGQRQPGLASLEDVREGEAVHQHRLAPSGDAVDQLEAVVLALLAGEGQHPAVGRPEDVVDGSSRERRGTAHGQEAQRLDKRRERRLRGAGAAEAGHRAGEGFERIAHERREHAFAPALGDLLQAAQPARELVPAVIGRQTPVHPGEHAETEAHHGLRAGVLLRQGAHGIAHGAAVGMGEGHEGRAHTADGRAEAAQPAALDQDREAAGEPGLGEALHQLGEGPRRPGAEGHVECAAEAAADADEAAAAQRIAHQELGRQRRREGAGLGRFGGPYRRVGSCGHGAPVGCGGVRPVEQHPHGPERRLVVEAFGHDAGLPEQCAEGVHERPVPWLEPVEHGQGALGLAGLRQPGPETRAQAFAGASGLGCRQDRGPGPAGEDRGLGSAPGGEATRKPRQHRERWAGMSRNPRPSRVAWRPARAQTRSTTGPAPSGSRSSTRWRAWPGAARRLLRRRQASSTKRSSSAGPVMDRAPSRRKSETSEPSAQASMPSPMAARGSMKLSSGLRRSAQLAASASSSTRVTRQLPAPGRLPDPSHGPPTTWAG